HRSCAIQGSLRPTQHFDSIQLENARIQAGQQRRIVNIKSSSARPADAADLDARLQICTTLILRLEGKIRYSVAVILNIRYAASLKCGAAKGGNTHGYVLQRLFPLVRGDDYFFQGTG